MGQPDDTDDKRREFLKLATFGAIGSLALPGCSDSAAETPLPPRTASVIGLIDVAQALADGTLNNNLYWIDNNTAIGSKNQGTAQLQTVARRGDTVIWVVSGLEVETDANITGFSGPAAEIIMPVRKAIALGITFWIGVIPTNIASGNFGYQVAIEVEKRPMASSPLTLTIL